MSLSLIVAVSDNGVIGRDNRLPWHLPDDLRYFKAMTLGKPVVMGRKTWNSLGRPLPGRTNIVLSRNPAFRAEGATVVHSLEQALAEARRHGPEIMIIGGAQLFAETLPLADRLYLTEVHAVIEGETLMPDFDRSPWREESRNPGLGEPAHDFVVLRRTASCA